MNSDPKTILREMRDLVRRAGGSPSPFGAGVELFGNEEFEKAAAAFRLALETDPGFAFSHYYLGRCLRRLGTYADAASCFRNAIELNPLHAPSHAYLGDICLKVEKVNEAEESFRRAVELQPDNIVALSGLAALAKNDLIDRDEAANLLETAYFEGSRNPVVLMELFSLQDPPVTLCLRIADGLAAERSYGRALFCYRTALRQRTDSEAARNGVERMLDLLKN